MGGGRERERSRWWRERENEGRERERVMSSLGGLECGRMFWKKRGEEGEQETWIE